MIYSIQSGYIFWGQQMSFHRNGVFNTISKLSIVSERSASRPAVTRIKAGTTIEQIIIDGEEMLSPVIGLIGDTYFEAGVIFKFNNKMQKQAETLRTVCRP